MRIVGTVLIVLTALGVETAKTATIVHAVTAAGAVNHVVVATIA